MLNWRFVRIRCRHGLALGVLLLSLVACTDHDTVQVRLKSRPPTAQGMMHLDITAEVAGAQSGLRYKWFAIAGGCNPQESDNATTAFKFADGAAKDRVSVEVWRGSKVVGRADLNVKLDELNAQIAMLEQVPKDLKIEITKVPPYEPQGGSDTRSGIAGTVSGPLQSEYGVVLYARASEVWYVQPMAYASHAIHPDNTWTSWTHTGSSYAALLVRPGFEPVPRLDVLPKIGGYVLARDIVEGVHDGNTAP